MCGPDLVQQQVAGEGPLDHPFEHPRAYPSTHSVNTVLQAGHNVGHLRASPSRSASPSSRSPSRV